MNEKLQKMADEQAREFKGNIYKAINETTGAEFEVFMISYKVQGGQVYILFSHNLEVPANIANSMVTFSREMEPNEFAHQEKLLRSATASEDEKINQILREQGLDLDDDEPQIIITSVEEPPPHVEEQAPSVTTNPLYTLLETIKNPKDVRLNINYDIEFPSKNLYLTLEESFDNVNDIIVDYYMEKVDVEKLRENYKKSIYEYIDKTFGGKRK
jgi:hypothetical protein